MPRRPPPPAPLPDDERAAMKEQLLGLHSLNVQALTIIKKALREPGVQQVTVFDVSPTEEIWVEVIATPRPKLILPPQ